MKKKQLSKVTWLENRIGFVGSFTLCCNESEYKAVIKSLNVPSPTPYNASMHTGNAWVKELVSQDGQQTFIVCLAPKLFENSVDVICGYMAHEATHIWQFCCEYIQEKNPSIEFEAYVIQHITQRLITELFSKKFPSLLSKKITHQKLTKR